MAGTLTTIWWRDIPAQVIAKDGRRAAKIVLHPRFQTAIDRAATKAGRRTMDEYIAEWRKTQRPCGPDLDAESSAEAERLEAAYPKGVLRTLIASGGAAGEGPVDAGAATGASRTTGGPTGPDASPLDADAADNQAKA
ncbi:MAG: virulence factor [Chloroflexi bacterium]|nr:virulence factor [Chloroflexota bacterium]